MNLELVKNILYIVYAIICVILIILTLVQKSEQEAGASQAITGSSSNSNFYDKNKGRTSEGLQKRWTIILGVIFVILTVVISILTLA
ncbi:MAG: preprotein translocase subunit SecG [Clostridia bacterium]|nr:preprotein translocase subunit SecG [Clostridia bacterium]